MSTSYYAPIPKDFSIEKLVENTTAEFCFFYMKHFVYMITFNNLEYYFEINIEDVEDIYFRKKMNSIDLKKFIEKSFISNRLECAVCKK